MNKKSPKYQKWRNKECRQASILTIPIVQIFHIGSKINNYKQYLHPYQSLIKCILHKVKAWVFTKLCK